MSELNTAATNIYNRLLSAPTFHPASADLFTDWNMQAGDVVTVKSDSDSYQVPIYNMKLKWTGAPKVEVESTGNPEREPLPAIKRREYSANSSNYKEQKSLRGGVGQAQSGVREINGILYAAGLQIDPVTGVWLYASEHGADYALGATFKVQSDAITAEVSRATAAEGSMSAQLSVQAGQISSKVSQTDYNGNTIASLINQTATTILIQAAHINLDGYVTANQFDALSASFNNLISGNLAASKITATAGNFSNLEITNSLVYGGYGDLKGKIINAFSSSASGGTITISSTTLDGSAGPSVNFNIADTQFYRNAVASAKTEGWNAARGYVSPPSAGTNASMTFGVPASTVNQGSSYDFTVSVDNNYAYIKNAVNTTVARVSNSAYNNGWAAAAAKFRRVGNYVYGPSSTVGDESSYHASIGGSHDYSASSFVHGGTTENSSWSGVINGVSVTYTKSSHSSALAIVWS